MIELSPTVKTYLESKGWIIQDEMTELHNINGSVLKGSALESYIEHLANSIDLFIDSQVESTNSFHVYANVIEQVERRLIEKAMEHYKKNQSHVALKLGVTRGLLRDRVNRFDIPRKSRFTSRLNGTQS